MPAPALLDLSRLEIALGGDTSMIGDILEMYESTAQADLDALGEERLEDEEVAGGGGEVERRLANIIHDVDLGARVLQQRRQGADRTHARAQMKSAQAQARTCE